MLENYIEPINTLRKFASSIVVIPVEDDCLVSLKENIIKFRSR